MTTNQTPIPEPTSPTEVVVGKRDGVTVVAAMMADHGLRWVAKCPNGGYGWRSWPELREELTDIRVVPVAEEAAEINRLTGRIAELEAMVTHGMESRARLVARIAELEDAKPEPGPWLRGDELEAVVPTLKAGDVVEVDYEGHTATGKLWEACPGSLLMGMVIIRWSDGKPGSYVDALRIIERAPEPEPEPGADIPDEVVAAAGEKIMELADEFIRGEVLRAALAAADAKRAELSDIAAAPTLLAELADEVERLRALTTVDDAMVERAARAVHGAAFADATGWDMANQPMRDTCRTLSNAALEAALGVES